MEKQWSMCHTFMQGEEFGSIIQNQGIEDCLRMRTLVYKAKGISRKSMSFLLSRWSSHPSEPTENSLKRS